jgi:hypothetical protein
VCPLEGKGSISASKLSGLQHTRQREGSDKRGQLKKL